LGELFQYRIETPVTVERGHSAMVPILSSDLHYRKDLLYNGAKMPDHPVATLRLTNQTGLTLERGPVTVIDGGEYVGEAILSFTPAEGEVAVPYAVELGARVREEQGASRQIHGLHIEGAYLRFEEWDVRWRDYQITNRTAKSLRVAVEHPRTAHFSLFDTPDPEERTGEHLRFQVQVQAHAEASLRVQERRLVSRREELRRQSYENLQRFLRQGLLDRPAYEEVAQLLRLWEQIGDLERRLQQIEDRRKQIYQGQQQMQGNMAALSTTGKEGTLRARYVEQLEASEEQLGALASEEAEKRAEIDHLKAEIEARIKDLE
jgi:flagellar biosynthesis/type III secretory pathway chaperone